MDVGEMLRKEGYDVIDVRQMKLPVDYIARRGEEVLVIKVLTNADALREEQAEDMKSLALTMKGRAVVVAERMRDRVVEEGKVYYRYGVPVISVETLERLLKGEEPEIMEYKGKEVVFLDSERLKYLRTVRGLSLQRLAELVGTTKETIYRYEHGYPASLGMAKKLERVLGEKLVLPVSLEVRKGRDDVFYPFTILKEKGIHVASFRRTYWSAIAGEETRIGMIEERKMTDRRLRGMRIFMNIVYDYYAVVSERRMRGKPFVTKEELWEVESEEDLVELVEGRMKGVRAEGKGYKRS